MSSCVLDASAVLALVNGEPGADAVMQAIAEGAMISTVNLAEAVGKLAQRGAPEAAIHRALDGLGIDVVHFDADMAYQAGLLSPVTKAAGLSLGDRACIVLARARGIPVLTGDRVWASLPLGVTVRIVR